MIEIEFIILLISLIFSDKRLTNYDLIKLLIIFLVCTADPPPQKCIADEDEFSQGKNDNNYRSMQNNEDKIIIDDKLIKSKEEEEEDQSKDDITKSIENNIIKNKYSDDKNSPKSGDSLKYDKKDSIDKIRLIDILKKRYKGVNITVSLANSSTFTGEVITVYKGILIVKGSNITYYIDGDYIVSFF